MATAALSRLARDGCIPPPADRRAAPDRRSWSILRRGAFWRSARHAGSRCATNPVPLCGIAGTFRDGYASSTRRGGPPCTPRIARDSPPTCVVRRARGALHMGARTPMPIAATCRRRIRRLPWRAAPWSWEETIRIPRACSVRAPRGNALNADEARSARHGASVRSRSGRRRRRRHARRVRPPARLDDVLCAVRRPFAGGAGTRTNLRASRRRMPHRPRGRCGMRHPRTVHRAEGSDHP